MHLELTTEKITIMPDTVQDQVFLSKLMNKKDILVFQIGNDAGIIYLESLENRP